MRFFVVEYPIETPTPNTDSGTEHSIGYRLFNFDHEQADAEEFCKTKKEFGVPVNIRIRDIPEDILQ